MSTFIKLFKLVYPFIQEFGLKEINIKQFILTNKTISYLLLVCFLMFMLFLYAIEQAHLRMLNRPVYLNNQEVLESVIRDKDEHIEQLEYICLGDGGTYSQNNSEEYLDKALDGLMGRVDEE